MAQPKTRSPRRRAQQAAAPDDTVVALLRDLLARGVMLPTERLRAVLDDAVRRGRMTRGDAEDLLQSLVLTGRQQTEDLLADLEQLLGRSRDAATGARRRTHQSADRVLREVDRAARRAAGLDAAFPIADYDELTAGEIVARLDELDPAELRRVHDYERKHGNRKTVLSAVERKLR